MGYFSPVMELRHEAKWRIPDSRFALPDCDKDCPTREEILWNGALEGQGSELGYAANRIDPFMMEARQWVFVHFGDDDIAMFSRMRVRTNKAYVSIGRVSIEA